MTDKHALQSLLENIKEEQGADDMDIRSYSGRAMYGKECLAVTGVTLGQLFGDVIDLVGNLARTGDEVDAIAEAFRDMKTDSMGRGTVVYFPNVPFVEIDEPEEQLECLIGEYARLCQRPETCNEDDSLEEVAFDMTEGFFMEHPEWDALGKAADIDEDDVRMRLADAILEVISNEPC